MASRTLALTSDGSKSSMFNTLALAKEIEPSAGASCES